MNAAAQAARVPHEALQLQCTDLVHVCIHTYTCARTLHCLQLNGRACVYVYTYVRACTALPAVCMGQCYNTMHVQTISQTRRLRSNTHTQYYN